MSGIVRALGMKKMTMIMIAEAAMIGNGIENGQKPNDIMMIRKSADHQVTVLIIYQRKMKSIVIGMKYSSNLFIYNVVCR